MVDAARAPALPAAAGATSRRRTCQTAASLLSPRLQPPPAAPGTGSTRLATACGPGGAGLSPLCGATLRGRPALEEWRRALRGELSAMTGERVVVARWPACCGFRYATNLPAEEQPGPIGCPACRTRPRSPRRRRASASTTSTAPPSAPASALRIRIAWSESMRTATGGAQRQYAATLRPRSEHHGRAGHRPRARATARGRRWRAWCLEPRRSGVGGKLSLARGAVSPGRA